MRDTILTFSVLLLPALYLSGFFFGVRQILDSTKATAMKGLLILGLIGLLVFVSLTSLAVLLAAAGGYNH
jgi:hypothetical protein